VLHRFFQAVVYCLLRELPGLTAMDRIRNSFQKFNIAEFDKNLEPRIVPIKGVSQQRCRLSHIQCEGQSLHVKDVMNIKFGTFTLLMIILIGDVG
jgi:hypothetical protein